MIYVDNLRKDGLYFNGKCVESCRLHSDKSEKELMNFASKIGLKKYQAKRSAHEVYFKLAEHKRQQAIDMGAVEKILEK